MRQAVTEDFPPVENSVARRVLEDQDSVVSLVGELAAVV